MDHCLILYTRLNSNDCIRTTINTLKKHSDCTIHVYSDTNEFETHHQLKSEDIKNRLALCKLECTLDLMNRIEGNLMVADYDLYFKSDPFTAFEQEFDLAITTRHHRHVWPVNGGVYFFRVNDQSRALTQCNINQANKPTWALFNRIREKKHGVNWSVGQAFLNACYKQLNHIEKKFCMKIIDVGSDYNYCPCNHVLGLQKAIRQLKSGYINKDIKVLHLKGRLKNCLYDGWLEDAITEEPTTRWYKK